MRAYGKLALSAALAALAASQLAAQSVSAPAEILVPDFAPVTDAEIQNPDPADWLSWRRTLDSWGHSPLTQINRDNVGGLRLVWVRPLSPGHQEGTPLVHEGIMYFPGPSDVIEAIDAASGQMLWQYRRPLPDDIGQYLPVYDTTRNLAIFGQLIIGQAADNYLYALNARTGALVWETQIDDYRSGAKISSGPIIADSLAITGRSCEPEGGPDACVIVAHDATTGVEVWRTSIIARGDDPNDASWGGVPLEQRQQVGAWMIASYDPELKLIYMGTSVSAPAPKIRLAGPDHDYLYHNSTLALDVRTGRIVWHYQHMVDHWDLDHTFARILVDQEVAPDPAAVAWMAPDIQAGRTYRTLTGIPGKPGIVTTLDRETGRFLWARPTVRQTVIDHIDGATGRAVLNPASVPSDYTTAHEVCPGPTGGANYMTGSYSPDTHTLFMPLQNLCAQMTALDPANSPGIYGMSQQIAIVPEAQGMLGSLFAVDAVTGRTRWEHRQRAGMQSLITTGGGLVFAGDAGGRFMALDQNSGEELWAMNLGSSVTGYPASFGYVIAQRRAHFQLGALALGRRILLVQRAREAGARDHHVGEVAPLGIGQRIHLPQATTDHTDAEVLPFHGIIRPGKAQRAIVLERQPADLHFQPAHALHKPCTGGPAVIAGAHAGCHALAFGCGEEALPPVPPAGDGGKAVADLGRDTGGKLRLLAHVD